MRTAYRIGSGVAAGLLAVAAVTALTSGPDGGATLPAAPPAPTLAPPAAPEPSDAEPADSGLTVVTRVVDGETLEVDGGRTVRLVGLDACALSTRGGREARAYLETFAAVGQRVRLIADGPRDTDDGGRLLRRVEVAPNYANPEAYHNDVGLTVVNHEAIGVARGGAGAGAGYLSALREKDYGRRDCS